jgi:hypothetical protein
MVYVKFYRKKKRKGEEGGEGGERRRDNIHNPISASFLFSSLRNASTSELIC